jgi:CRISPR-associated endoribonuclease Cas6
MRVRVVFQVLNEGGFVPFHQQVLLSSFVYDFIPEQFFGSETWNFSGLKGQTRVTAKGLFYNSQKVTMVFSSPSTELVRAFVQNLFSCNSIGLAGLELRPIQILEERVDFISDVEKYVCISPLVILAEGLPDEELKQFISPVSGSFADLLYESTMSRMENAGFDVEKFSGPGAFRFVADEEYLSKAKESDRKYSRIYSLEGTGNFHDLRGYTFPFFLEAHPDVHRFVFQSGFGEATRNGFGMIDLADKKDRTRLLEFSFDSRQMAGRA